jgi:steroid delta-isomerase-like uncharacterized protein
MASNIDIVQQSLDAFAKGDWKTYRSLCTDDIIYEEEATRRHVQGPDAFIELLKEWKSAFSDLRAVVKQTVASGDAVVVEVEWHGTHDGLLTGPFGDIAPTGRTAMTPAVLVLRFDNGRIREDRHYFDLMTALSQLGAVPTGAAQPSAR